MRGESNRSRESLQGSRNQNPRMDEHTLYPQDNDVEDTTSRDTTRYVIERGGGTRCASAPCPSEARMRVHDMTTM